MGLMLEKRSAVGFLEQEHVVQHVVASRNRARQLGPYRVSGGGGGIRCGVECGVCLGADTGAEVGLKIDGGGA